jgi:hypothetical protein
VSVLDLGAVNVLNTIRFKSYDFKKMQRRSYYPHNQIISMATGTSSSGVLSSRPETPTGHDSRPELANGGLLADAPPIDTAQIDRMLSDKSLQ